MILGGLPCTASRASTSRRGRNADFRFLTKKALTSIHFIGIKWMASPAEIHLAPMIQGQSRNFNTVCPLSRRMRIALNDSLPGLHEILSRQINCASCTWHPDYWRLCSIFGSILSNLMNDCSLRGQGHFLKSRRVVEWIDFFWAVSITSRMSWAVQ
jgi:hypothetical protein